MKKTINKSMFAPLQDKACFNSVVDAMFSITVQNMAISENINKEISDKEINDYFTRVDYIINVMREFLFAGNHNASLNFCLDSCQPITRLMIQKLCYDTVSPKKTCKNAVQRKDIGRLISAISLLSGNKRQSILIVLSLCKANKLSLKNETCLKKSLKEFEEEYTYRNFNEFIKIEGNRINSFLELSCPNDIPRDWDESKQYHKSIYFFDQLKKEILLTPKNADKI